jgi:hypothetical protein
MTLRRPHWWTPERAAYVLELRAAGKGPVLIARELGLGIGAIRNMLYRARQPDWDRPFFSPQWPPERITQALELRRQGQSYTQIADALDTTRSAIAGLMHRRLPASVDQLGARLNWSQVQQTGCRWIDGDPTQPGWTYCGAPCTTGTAWCATHAKHVHQRDPAASAGSTAAVAGSAVAK